MTKLTKVMDEEVDRLKVVVIGAGAIGTFIGSSLQYSSDQHRLPNGDEVEVTLISRSRLKSEVEHTDGVISVIGLHLDRFACRPTVTDDLIGSLAVAEVVIVAVKAFATEAVAASIAEAIANREPDKPPLLVYSFQNGVSNKTVLQKYILAPHAVVSCMVEMNVVWDTNAHFHMTSNGAIYVEHNVSNKDLEPVHQRFIKALTGSLYVPPIVYQGDFRDVLYSKLLVNLINPVNALAGCSIATLLQSKGYRQAWALLWEEAYAVFKAAGIKPITLKAAPSLFPFLCRLPTFAWNAIAKLKGSKTMENAKTSMLVDLENKDRTEIEFLCGAVVEVAKQAGVPAPINSRMLKLVKGYEEKAEGSPNMSDVEILQHLRQPNSSD